MLEDAHALAIGVSEYESVRKLSECPIYDATDLAALLKNPARGGYPAENVRLMLNGEATRAGILAALAALAARTSPESTVWISFSGHGGRRIAGRHAGEYLLPIDASMASDDALAASAISTAELAGCLRAIHARKLLLVLDCCHASGIGALRSAHEEEDLRAGFSRAAQAALSQGSGRALLLAARADEPAVERKGDRNGLFTKHLLAGLRGGAVCTGGTVRVFDLFDYVQRHVQADRPAQHPVFKAELEENFPIVHCPAPMQPPDTAPLDGFSADVFVHCFDGEIDRRWARTELTPALLRRGLRVLDADRFHGAIPRIKQLERAVTRSRYTLAVLSRAYLQSGFAELGDLMAQYLGTEEGGYRLLAVLREPCTPRLGIRLAPVLDLSVAKDFEAQIDRLAESLRQPVPAV